MLLGLVIADAVWNALIAGVVTGFLAWTNYKLQIRLKEIERVGNLTHQLANSAMLGQKKLLAEAYAVTAARTKDPEDIIIAEQAKAIYEEHRANQKVMEYEARTKTSPLPPPPAAPQPPPPL